MATNYVDASYAADEKTFSGWVRLIVKVKGLKVKSKGGLFSKKKVPKNVTIEEPTFGTRTVLVEIVGKDDLDGKNIQLNIKRLPYDICSESSYIETEENRVLVFLKKSESGQSWRTYIEGNGIETED